MSAGDGVGIDYKDVFDFFVNVQKHAATNMQAQMKGAAVNKQYETNIGAVGTESAMYFQAFNNQAVKSFMSFIFDASHGQVYLANAVGRVGIEYNDGDVTSSMGISAVVDGILNPGSGKNTMRAQEAAAAAKAGDPAAVTGGPQMTLDPKTGNLLDQNGKVILTAAQLQSYSSGGTGSGSTTTANPMGTLAQQQMAARTQDRRLGFGQDSDHQRPCSAAEDRLESAGARRAPGRQGRVQEDLQGLQRLRRRARAGERPVPARQRADHTDGVHRRQPGAATATGPQGPRPSGELMERR